MIVKCSCGFEGSLKPIKVLDKEVGKCYGCDQLYEYQSTGLEERVVPMDKMPDIKDWDELMDFMSKTPEGSKTKASKASTGKPRKRAKRTKPAEADTSTSLKVSKPPVPIYKTLHMYLRPGDTWPELLKFAREEQGYAGSAQLVFAHNHAHGEACTDSCREVVES